MSSYMPLPYMDGIEPIIRGSTPQQQQPPPQQPQLPLYKEVKEERLSPLLTSCPASQPAPSYHQHMMNHHQQQQQQQQQQQSTTSSLLNTANHVVGHLLYNALPQDLDLEPTLFNSGLECDVDQVLRHELSVEGNLDFNFENSGMNGSSSNSQHHQPPITSTRSWVHWTSCVRKTREFVRQSSGVVLYQIYYYACNGEMLKNMKATFIF